MGPSLTLQCSSSAAAPLSAIGAGPRDGRPPTASISRCAAACFTKCGAIPFALKVLALRYPAAVGSLRGGTFSGVADVGIRLWTRQGDVLAEMRTTLIGVGLASTILIGWVATHVFSIFFLEIRGQTAPLVPLLVLFQSWLSVGLFIVAHDAIHGTLAPTNRGLNNAVGRIAINLYGGFDFDKLARAHHLHHRHSGTELDPDFSSSHPNNVIIWALCFFSRHLTWRVLLFFPVVFNVYLYFFGAERLNLILFFCLPALMSAFQLFLFGTFLPHRHDGNSEFADEHRSRSSNVGRVISLLTCYHFGYHHEHHLYPYVPWWKLPGVRWRRSEVA